MRTFQHCIFLRLPPVHTSELAHKHQYTWHIRIMFTIYLKIKCYHGLKEMDYYCRRTVHKVGRLWFRAPRNDIMRYATTLVHPLAMRAVKPLIPVGEPVHA